MNHPIPLDERLRPQSLVDLVGQEQYSHLGENNFLIQEYLADEHKGTAFYQSHKNTREEELKKCLQARWKGKNGYSSLKDI